MIKTYAYGFPRLGGKREYKKIIESFWAGKISEDDLTQSLDQLQEEILNIYSSSVNLYPVGEMTGYDPMFDTAVMLGLYEPENLKSYYDFCRGKQALGMTKWFNTNYHYLVPEFEGKTPEDLFLNWNKPKEYHNKFKRGIPYLMGPFTFLKLSNGVDKNNFKPLLMRIGEIYQKILSSLDKVHLDEPSFVMELSHEEIQAVKDVYHSLGQDGRCEIYVFTYYEAVDFLETLLTLPVKGIGLDFVHGSAQMERLKAMGFPDDKTLICGLVDGRNIWRTDITRQVRTLEGLSKYVKQLMVSNAGPLYHLPITVEGEDLPEGLLSNLAFAKQRLGELKLISAEYSGKPIEKWYSPSDFGTSQAVRERVKALSEDDFIRTVPYSDRARIQRKQLQLPFYPTTTIGSFPQTPEIRKQRSDYQNGTISLEEYKEFIRNKIADLIRFQEELGIDVLVHGEFERSDMVEFFAERLKGIATTKNGWILSYGTRGYRPPIIFGDVSRPGPLTIDEISYAQSLTKSPVKGMLTGPITILAWSFVREDIPISEVAYQIALCLQDEIKDYEKAGIKIVQVDEPAFREKAPIKRRNWDTYFDWAIKGFRLATIAKPVTQIHSHMCYSEFGEIMDKIVQLDFDVIFIEATRSKGHVIESFEKVNFDRQIGLGVWDIHSPAVPSVDGMKQIIQRASKILPKENLWINPDCGLKTRQWKETAASLKNLIALSKELRY